MRGARWLGLWVIVVAACGGAEADDERPTSATLEGNTACERWASLAEAVGCDVPAAECGVAAACNDLAVVWIDCAARDLAQCMCESDGDLNCEGSYKSNEGPARCIAEVDAFEACEP
jgi:hypothetical protein